MIRGYARVSTAKQAGGTSLYDQREQLEREGCEIIYEDVYTGATMDRNGFDQLKADVQPGDTVVFTKIDRIGRTATAAYEQVHNWMTHGITIRILNMGVIENSPTGRLTLHIMLAFSEFERDLINIRCQGGRAYKRATDPNYREGRKPGFTKAQLDHAMELLLTHSYTDVSKMTGISRSSIQREARRRGFRADKRTEKVN